MQSEEMETELIGFENDRPITKKLKLENNIEGKQVVLKKQNLQGKFIILNKNVKIPIKLCGVVPENVRKAVLGKLSQTDKVQMEAKSYLNVNQLDNKSGTLHESGNSHQGDTHPNQSVVTPNDSGKDIKDSHNSTSEKNKLIEGEKRNKRRHMDVKKQNNNSRIKRKRPSQQKTLQNIVRYLKKQKQNQKSQIKRVKVEKRSISCQTETNSISKSCQTEKSAGDDLFNMDILSLLENSEKDGILGSPFSISNLGLDGSASPSPHINTHLGQGVGGRVNGFGNMDTKKLMFYEGLKKCDYPNPAGHIPLHLAALENNKIEVHNQCLLLKARKLSIDIPNNQGMTPLHLAVLNECDIDLIKNLLSNGADPLMKDSEGNTSIHHAVECNAQEDILKMLLNHVIKTNKGTVDVFNYEGFTPLMLCVIEDKYQMACQCINAGADPNTKDQKSGRTSLFHAVENNNLQMVKLFMKTGANTKIKNFFGTSTHEATFELENINPDIKALIIGKDATQTRPKPSLMARKKKKIMMKSAEVTPPAFKNKLKTIRILKIIEKDRIVP